MDNDCPNCGRPLKVDANKPVELHVCPGCGYNLDKPVKSGDQPAKKYRKLLEG